MWVIMRLSRIRPVSICVYSGRCAAVTTSSTLPARAEKTSPWKSSTCVDPSCCHLRTTRPAMPRQSPTRLRRDMSCSMYPKPAWDYHGTPVRLLPPCHKWVLCRYLWAYKNNTSVTPFQEFLSRFRFRCVLIIYIFIFIYMYHVKYYGI